MQKFHSLAIPTNKSYRGMAMCVMLNARFEHWLKNLRLPATRLISVRTDKAGNVTGRSQGDVIRFKEMTVSSFYRTWFVAHQIGLLTQQ